MPCKATDLNPSTTCRTPGTAGTPAEVQVFDPYDPDCEGASVEIIDCPRFGVVADAGGGVLEYTPCENFVGADDFSYTIVNSQDPDPGTGIVRINVAGDNCNWYEANPCSGSQTDLRVWIAKSFVEREGAAFKYEGLCYRADTSCTKCPDEEGVKLSNPQPLPEGCDDPECDYRFYDFVTCCGAHTHYLAGRLGGLLGMTLGYEGLCGYLVEVASDTSRTLTAVEEEDFTIVNPYERCLEGTSGESLYPDCEQEGLKVDSKPTAITVSLVDQIPHIDEENTMAGNCICNPDADNENWDEEAYQRVLRKVHLSDTPTVDLKQCRTCGNLYEGILWKATQEMWTRCSDEGSECGELELVHSTVADVKIEVGIHSNGDGTYRFYNARLRLVTRHEKVYMSGDQQDETYERETDCHGGTGGCTDTRTIKVFHDTEIWPDDPCARSLDECGEPYMYTNDEQDFESSIEVTGYDNVPPYGNCSRSSATLRIKVGEEDSP